MTVATEPPLETAASRQRWHLLQVLALLCPIVFVLVLAWLRRWTFEDAFINFRVVNQIRAGHGPVFNVGQRVEVTTSPLWLWILVVLRTVAPFIAIERLAIVGGLVMTGLGLWWAEQGARELWRTPDRRELFVPVGIVVVAATAATWDWTTSGLENGLTTAWIGLLMLMLGRLQADEEPPQSGRVARLGFVVGLGPLVRPDLAIMTLVVLIAVVLILRPRGRALALFLGSLLALPVAYQIFRMGYYATPVPNTALAKDASGTYWHQGWVYLLDFLMPYWLLVPLAALAFGLVRLLRERRARQVAAALALPIAGVLHALYITRSGGDYVHARLLLPSLFAIVAPLSVVPWRRLMFVPITVVGIWAIAAAGFFRPQIHYSLVPLTQRNVVDARGGMADAEKRGHRPVLATDFRIRDGAVARRLERQGRRALVTIYRPNVFPDATPRSTTLVSSNSGISGFEAGPDVLLQETNSLGDPVGSRMAALDPSTAGHRKKEPMVWILAMVARPGVTLGFDGQQIAQARNALSCGALHDLVDATEKPLTVGGFLSNIVHSYTRMRLVVPRLPAAAERKFCGTQG